ncbi:MAG: SH3 domain-containing protein [Spirochaetes bacterium]|nr:SH3 domain-containing protein [Spirochaetota bacterium]MBN2770199.1 SH3 domain-containing protein [Spirochaetota bacterium]
MKRSMFLWLIMLLTACAADKSDSTIDEDIETKEVFAVALNDYSAVRFQPQIHSSRTDYLMKGDTVKIIMKSAEESRIARIKDYWYYVQLSSGIVGWTFGSNIRILKEGDGFSIEDYQKQVAQENIERIVKELTGKWWSVTSSGNFTSHSLILYEDKKYRSSRGGVVKKGEYSLDMDKNLIIFSDGATFGNDLTLVQRGVEILIEKETEDYKYRFKKISSETDDEEKPESYDTEI